MKFMWAIWALVLFLIISFFSGFYLPLIPNTGNPLANSTIATALIIGPFVYLWEKYVRKKAGGL